MPKKGYFELLDQPAIIIPYTLNEEVANKYKTPTFRSNNTICLDRGRTAQPIKLKIKVSIGAIKNILIVELLGNIVSFTNSFSPSPNGCSKPRKPITFGPFFSV